MYQAKREKGLLIVIEIWLGIIFITALLVLTLHSIPKPDSILVLSGLAVVLAPASGIAALFLIRDKGGVPFLEPEAFRGEDFIFCPIKEEDNLCLVTIDDFDGETAALSLDDFTPKDASEIRKRLSESLETGQRIKIAAYGHKMRQGYLFLLDRERQPAKTTSEDSGPDDSQE